jgi:hypothetical protein
VDPGKGRHMEKSSPRDDYETPKVTDHGDLAQLTAANHPFGVFDADYHQGDPIPPGGAGTSSQP